MFFSNSIANKKGFLHRPALFRGWTGGADREAGSWQTDAVQTHEHDIPTWTGLPGARAVMHDDEGTTCESNRELMSGRFYTYSSGPSGRLSDETRPTNLAVPVCVYLGEAWTHGLDMHTQIDD